MAKRARPKRGKPDANQRDIVEALTGAHNSVLDLSNAAIEGVPDLLVGARYPPPCRCGCRCARNVLMEVKTATGSLRPGQIAWHRTWRGLRVEVVRTVEEALAAVGR